MFIRPVGVTVHAAQRPPGHPLLRGLLARAAGTAETTTGAVTPDEPPRRGLLARAVQAAEHPPEPEPEREREPEPEPEPEPEHPATHPEPGHEPEHERPHPAHLVAELTQLADLTREGLLTPEEFTAAKTRLLRD
ncbi:SHOCT domain-containing protein [Streptomyces sp. NPDC048337]|uniref:SHOCT domain-containing protein n=1 Tax=Streptomyces sp. NPDC048337 TaxID=3365535 RepID=UPI0037167B2E